MGEEGILATAADDVEHVEREGGQFLEPVEDGAIAEREGFHDETCNLCIGLGDGLTGLLAVFADGTEHRGRIGEHRVVGVDERTEGFAALLHFAEGLEVVVLAHALPFLAALFENPHAGDVLEETCGAFDTAFVGEVEFEGALADDGVLRLDAHERPGARGEIGELLVLGRNGSDGGACVVTSDGNDGDVVAEVSHLGLEVADDVAWEDHGRELADVGTSGLDEFAVDLLGARVEELGGGEDGVFADSLAGEVEAYVVGDEDILGSLLEGTEAFLVAGVELEEGVEVDELDTCLLVDLLTTDFLDIFVHGSHGVGIAVGAGFLDHLAVLVDKDDINAPGINTDGIDADVGTCSKILEASDHFADQGGHVPVELAIVVFLLDGVGETTYFFGFKNSLFIKTGDNHSSTGGTEIDGANIMLHVI